MNPIEESVLNDKPVKGMSVGPVKAKELRRQIAERDAARSKKSIPPE